MVNIGNKFLSKIIMAAALMLVFITLPANAELEIVLDSISPQPVEPGQDFLLSVNLANGNTEVKAVTLEILPDSPMILKDEKDRVVDAGNIIKYSAFAKIYNLHIDPHAHSGEYDIDFRTSWLDNDQMRKTNKTIKVVVRGIPQLAISNITINPEHISPQDTFDLAFTVSNEGSGIARDILVGAATAGLPFVTDGVDTKVIKALEPGESNRLNYYVMVKDKADISSYSLPIKMEYKDENGKNISSQSLVGVKVLGSAKLSIASIKTEPQNPAKDELVTVTMRIENSGTGDAKSAKMIVTIPFEGNKTVFLGKIKPNDDAPAVFTFKASESGNVPFSVTSEFEDDLGVHTQTWALNQYVYGGNGNNIAASAGVLAIVGGTTAFFLFRRKKTG
ncbi:MAG TPA: COG1361 S-layer family protein [Candidatus Methanoperedens sp.]